MGIGVTSLEQAEPTYQEEVIEVAVQQFHDTLEELYLVEVWLNLFVGIGTSREERISKLYLPECEL